MVAGIFACCAISPANRYGPLQTATLLTFMAPPGDSSRQYCRVTERDPIDQTLDTRDQACLVLYGRIEPGAEHQHGSACREDAGKLRLYGSITSPAALLIVTSF